MLASRRTTRRTVAALVVASLAVLSGCSGGSDSAVAAKPAELSANALCAKASRNWPSTVAGLSRHAVSTTSPTVRAWGKDADSAIIARCGVTSPGPTTDACFSADDIDWVTIPLSDGNRFVTYGRSPAIEVLVPSSTHLDGTLLAAFTSAARAIPQGQHHCD